jgi:uncharacterized protein
MPTVRLADPVLVRFRQALTEAYGPSWNTWCCSARARGDARPDSDYDIAVFIHEPESVGDESGRLAAIETDTLCDTGAVINSLPFYAGAHRDRIGLTLELRRDGIDL